MFHRIYDVAICGGGIAGTAAALASARHGKKTVLIEKTIMSGGLATSGLIWVYLPLCDGNGTQVLFGITEELLLAGLKYGPGTIPDWRKGNNADEEKRYRILFSPASLALALDELLVHAGVDIWYDTLICATDVQDGHLRSVYVENKSGRGEISATCFVDATGDADVAHLAGLSCGASSNALAYWVLEHAKGDQWVLDPSVASVSMHAFGDSQDTTEGGIDGKVVTQFILTGRAQYREQLNADYTTERHTRTTRFPLALPIMPQLRTIRQICAQYQLRDNDSWRPFDDSIGMTSDWRRPGSVWEIPYRTMLPVAIKNLVAAGRCTAAETDAWEVTRVIPSAVLTGEAAGTAAALCTERSISPDELPVTELQQALKDAGNKIHFDEIGLAPPS